MSWKAAAPWYEPKREENARLKICSRRGAGVGTRKHRARLPQQQLALERPAIAAAAAAATPCTRLGGAQHADRAVFVGDGERQAEQEHPAAHKGADDGHEEAHGARHRRVLRLLRNVRGGVVADHGPLGPARRHMSEGSEARRLSAQSCTAPEELQGAPSRCGLLVCTGRGSHEQAQQEGVEAVGDARGVSFAHDLDVVGVVLRRGGAAGGGHVRPAGTRTDSTSHCTHTTCACAGPRAPQSGQTPRRRRSAPWRRWAGR